MNRLPDPIADIETAFSNNLEQGGAEACGKMVVDLAVEAAAAHEISEAARRIYNEGIGDRNNSTPEDSAEIEGMLNGTGADKITAITRHSRAMSLLADIKPPEEK